MARLPSSLLSYRVDWDTLDDAIDGGAFVRWIDAPAWRYFGDAVMEHVLAGRAECPICYDAVIEADGSIEWVCLRGRRDTCEWCLRKGAESRVPAPVPPRHVARAAEIQFQAKIDGLRRKVEEAKSKRKKAAS